MASLLLVTLGYSCTPSKPLPPPRFAFCTSTAYRLYASCSGNFLGSFSGTRGPPSSNIWSRGSSVRDEPLLRLLLSKTLRIFCSCAEGCFTGRCAKRKVSHVAMWQVDSLELNSDLICHCLSPHDDCQPPHLTRYRFRGLSPCVQPQALWDCIGTATGPNAK